MYNSVIAALKVNLNVIIFIVSVLKRVLKFKNYKLGEGKL
ncbi:hypothetical protein GCWU000323_01276 [Leptotrichia hofstadii F0254]|uniref:Uncharacterized protein n=1 Tax=Leptotrichia hofstadii F0254 TaxID=634994 RepID=C9MXM8_9FUSO|nr:hypothetical protein GCWU000323_01276 [Leptotrichia hofstadii F0254]